MTVNPARRDIDPFQLELMKSCFDTIADDMALTLMRTAHSGIVRDSLDFSTALLDAEGLTLAQGICTPMHMGSFHDAMRKLIDQYDGRVDPGDVFIFNDPYAAEGQHLPDIYITTPVFTRESRGSRGRLVAWATTVAHHSDVGGIVAGSNALGAEEIFQEGLRLPIVKFMARGEPNHALWDVIALNVRTPEKVMGDLQAQLASCRSGEREMLELFERYGVDTVLDYGKHLQNYAERLTRAEIAEFPDGVYEFTDHIEGLGENPELVVVKTTVTVGGRCRLDRLHRHLWPDQGRHQPDLPVHEGVVLRGAALGDGLRHSELPRLHGADHGHRAEGLARQSPFSVSLRRARHHRVPDHRLPVRRAGAGAPRPGDGGHRGRVDAADDRRLREREGVRVL